MGQTKFSIKRLIFRNKTTILLTVLILIIIVLLSRRPDESRNRFNNILKSFHEKPYSKVELNNYYKFKLGVSTNTNEINSIQDHCENVWMIAALPGNGVEDYLWEYLSLLAIEQIYGQKNGRNIKKFLSNRSSENLKSMFNSITFSELNTIPERCYRLSEAVLIENGNNIYFNENLQVKSMFLLDEGERRYQEIVKSDLKEIRKNFEFNERLKEIATLEIMNFKARVEKSPESSVEIVAIYIQTLQLPSSYYQKAMQFQRQLHYDVIFMVICPDELLKSCRDNFYRTDTSVIRQRNSLELDLAIMSLCNHTIVENDIGILSALISENGGDTVVYAKGLESKMQWFSNQMDENVDKWYIIA